MVFNSGITIFAKNLEKMIRIKWLRLFQAVIYSLFLLVFSTGLKANEEGTSEKLDPAKIIMEHIQDSHEFHFFTLKQKDGGEFHATIPLPVILYSPQNRIAFVSTFHPEQRRFTLFFTE